MTDQEINEAIAVECGWTSGTDDDGWWDQPSGLPSFGVPSFTTDLNAIADAEAIFDNDIADPSCRRYTYSRFLYQIVPAHIQPLRATARQRAEAFLRTVGKWRER